MEYGFLFFLLAVTLVYYGCASGGWAWLLLWPALSFLVVACGYWGLGARVFGKRGNGRIAWYSLVILAPYLFYAWAVWHLSRILRKEDCYNEIAPKLYLGRRALPHELPADVKVVVDLTAEFPEPTDVRKGRRYLCLPTLDASMPKDTEFKALLQTLIGVSEPMYIHCAEGHGRSGMLAAALLMLKGLAKDIEEAVGRLQAVRPGVGLRKSQKEMADRLATELMNE